MKLRDPSEMDTTEIIEEGQEYMESENIGQRIREVIDKMEKEREERKGGEGLETLVNVE